MKSLTIRNTAQAAGTFMNTRPLPRIQHVCRACSRSLAKSRSTMIPARGLQHIRPLSVSSMHRISEDTTTTATKESLIPSNYYEYFPQSLGPDAIPPKGPFAIDIKVLRQEFLQLQAKAHPDMVAQNKKRQAEGLSARINEAYKTLQDPLKRAQYLLSLRGIDVAEDETAKVEDPDLLLEVLETRETIEEAQEESDLDELKLINDRRIAGSVETLAEAFRDDHTEAAKAESVRLRYWTNIKESIDGWEKGKPVVLVH